MASCNKPLVVWRGAGPLSVACSPQLVANLGERALGGYRRYPWGGVECGGLLFGARDETGVQVLSYRQVDCEHEYGPVFQLSAKDLAGLDRLLAKVVEEEEQKGLTPVGWYHTLSSRDLGLSSEDRHLHERLFPEPWQVCMIVRRSKRDPLAIGFFARDVTGTLEALSTPREFATEDFRIRESALPLASEPEPEPAQAPAPPPQPQAPAIEKAEVVLAPVVVMPSPAPVQSVPPAAQVAAAPVQEALPAPPGVAEPSGKKAAPVESQAPAWVLPPAPENPYEYFGFAHDPFSQTPDPRLFYPAPGPREALAILQHGVQRRSGFSALIGESGVGKSLVLECLIEQLKTERVQFAYLFNSRVNADQFFELLANDLDLPCPPARKTSILIALNEHLVRQCQVGQTTALIIDNAQKLQPEVLEEIELLGNLENRQGKLLQVVFAGQPSFERRLERPELRGLRQRLLSRARLGPLNQDQTEGYIASRVKMAGGQSHEPFAAEVLTEVFLRTGGVPRLINAVCSGLLQRCMESRTRQAGLAMLEPVCNALDLSSPRREDQDPHAAAEAVSA